MNRGEQVRIKVRRPEGGHYSFEHGESCGDDVSSAL